MKLRTRTIHFAQDNTAQATPGGRPSATGWGIIIYTRSDRILPFKNAQAYMMAQNIFVWHGIRFAQRHIHNAKIVVF